MKKILNIFTLAVLAVMAASCNKNVEFQHETFATFASVSYNVPENVGKIVIPVKIYNPTGGELQVTVKASGESAVQGTDYEIVNPASGILTFSGDVDSLAVEIDIKSFEGEFTGSKNFAITLESANAALSIGNFNTASITILDLDHPLSMFAGDWEGTLVFASNPPTPLAAVMNFAIDTEDNTYTKMIVSGWEAHPSYKGYAVPVNAVYDAEKSTINITTGQTSWIVSSYYNFIFTGIDDNGYMSDLVLAYDKEAGTLTQMNAFGSYNTTGAEEDLGFFSLYQPGAVFTKKQ